MAAACRSRLYRRRLPLRWGIRSDVEEERFNDTVSRFLSIAQREGPTPIASTVEAYVVAALHHTSRGDPTLQPDDHVDDAAATEGSLHTGAPGHPRLSSLYNDDVGSTLRGLRHRLATLQALEQHARLITLRPLDPQSSHAAAWKRITKLRRDRRRAHQAIHIVLASCRGTTLGGKQRRTSRFPAALYDGDGVTGPRESGAQASASYSATVHGWP